MPETFLIAADNPGMVWRVNGVLVCVAAVLLVWLSQGRRDPRHLLLTGVPPLLALLWLSSPGVVQLLVCLIPTLILSVMLLHHSNRCKDLKVLLELRAPEHLSHLASVELEEAYHRFYRLSRNAHHADATGRVQYTELRQRLAALDREKRDPDPERLYALLERRDAHALRRWEAALMQDPTRAGPRCRGRA